MTDQDWALVRIIQHWPMGVGATNTTVEFATSRRCGLKVADLPWNVELGNIPSHLYRGICQSASLICLINICLPLPSAGRVSPGAGPGLGPGQLSIAEHFPRCQRVLGVSGGAALEL